MDRRFSTALTVSLLFMVAYLFIIRPGPKPAPVEPTTVPEVASAATTADQASARTPEEPVLAPEATRVEVNDDILVTTPWYVARFTNRGAGLVELISHDEYRKSVLRGEHGEQDDLDNRLAFCEDMDPAHPSLLLQTNPGSGVPIHELTWDYDVGEVGGQQAITFRFDDGEGTRYTKLIRFLDPLQLIEVSITIEFAPDHSPGQPAYFLTAAGNLPNPGSASFQTPPSSVVAYGDQFLRKSAGAPGDVSVQGQRVEYYGTTTNYFSMVLRPDDATAKLITAVRWEPVLDRLALDREVEAMTAVGRPPTAADLAELREDHLNNVRAIATLSVPAGPGRVQKLGFTLFAGPKSPKLMADDVYAPFRTLYNTDDYGSLKMFRWINPVLLWVLDLFQRFVVNWGLSIILLTVVVKSLLFPLNRLQSRSMEQFQKKMAKLKPRLDELKKKHKSNMRKFHEEQQKLMRENNVRAPVLGCLIIFLQFPVFIGLFQILRFSFELRHQPFFFWINDLSMPDALPLPFALPLIGASLNVLPLLMIVAMVAHAKSMPKPADAQAAQMQKTMMFMPFIFGVFLYSYPSGLSLYMLTNALLGIVQAKYLKVSTAT